MPNVGDNISNQPPDPIPSQPDPETTLYFEEPPAQPTVFGANNGGYDLWKCWARTRGRTGWRLMPAAGDDSQGPLPCRPVKLSAGYTRIIVYYRAIRSGAWPELPDPRPTDSNLTLLWWDDRVQAAPHPDGFSWVYTGRGKRVYGCTAPVYGWASGLLVPSPPCCTASRGSLNVPANAFVQKIV